MVVGYVRIEKDKRKSFFKVGRVFMMIFPEETERPARENTKDSTHYSKAWPNLDVHTECRRMVVLLLNKGSGSCICASVCPYRMSGHDLSLADQYIHTLETLLSNLTYPTPRSIQLFTPQKDPQPLTWSSQPMESSAVNS